MGVSKGSIRSFIGAGIRLEGREDSESQRDSAV
jgi:hypothetical protein